MYLSCQNELTCSTSNYSLSKMSKCESYCFRALSRFKFHADERLVQWRPSKRYSFNETSIERGTPRTLHSIPWSLESRYGGKMYKRSSNKRSLAWHWISDGIGLDQKLRSPQPIFGQLLQRTNLVIVRVIPCLLCDQRCCSTTG